MAVVAAMSTGHRIKVKNFRVDKTGRLIRTPTYHDVSAKLRARGSKRIRVVSRGAVGTTKKREET